LTGLEVADTSGSVFFCETMVATAVEPETDEYLYTHDVPIMDAHAAPNRPKPFDNMNEALLRHIIEVNNQRFEDTGDEIPIAAAHTVKGIPSLEQPPIIGYASGLYLGQFGRVNPRPCIYAKNWRIRKKYADLANERPRRSIEIWPKSYEIDPIALCGADTPERHLGQVRFGRDDERITVLAPLKYERIETMLEEADIQKIVAAMMQTPTKERKE